MNVVRILIIICSLMLVSLGLQFVIYGFDFTYEYVSNAMFVVGIVTFLPSLIVVTGSYEVFYGFRYSASLVFSKGFRKRYPSYVEYRDDRNEKQDTTFFFELMAVAFLMIIIAAFLAGKV